MMADAAVAYLHAVIDVGMIGTQPVVLFKTEQTLPCREVASSSQQESPSSGLEIPATCQAMRSLQSAASSSPWKQ